MKISAATFATACALFASNAMSFTIPTTKTSPKLSSTSLGVSRFFRVGSEPDSEEEDNITNKWSRWVFTEWDWILFHYIVLFSVQSTNQCCFVFQRFVIALILVSVSFLIDRWLFISPLFRILMMASNTFLGETIFFTSKTHAIVFWHNPPFRETPRLCCMPPEWRKKTWTSHR